MELPLSQRTSINSIVRVVASLNCVGSCSSILSAMSQVQHRSTSCLCHYGLPKYQAPVLLPASEADTEFLNACCSRRFRRFLPLRNRCGWCFFGFRHAHECCFFPSSLLRLNFEERLPRQLLRVYRAGNWALFRFTEWRKNQFAVVGVLKEIEAATNEPPKFASVLCAR